MFTAPKSEIIEQALPSASAPPSLSFPFNLFPTFSFLTLHWMMTSLTFEKERPIQVGLMDGKVRGGFSFLILTSPRPRPPRRLFGLLHKQESPLCCPLMSESQRKYRGYSFKQQHCLPLLTADVQTNM